MSFTSTTRVTGLSSGMDIDALVEQLMSAESAKYKSLQRKSQKVQWQQEAYRSIISKLQSFQNKWFGSSASSTNFRYSTAFKNFQSTVMNADNTASSAITVNSASSDAEYSIEVLELAQADTYMGKSKFKSDITTGKTLTQITDSIKGENGEPGVDLEFSVTLDGVSKNIKVTADDLKDKSITDAINEKLKSAFGSQGDTPKVQVEQDGSGLKFAVNVDEGVGHVLSVGEGPLRDSQSVTTGAFNIDKIKEDLEEGESKDVTFDLDVNGTTKKITVSVDKDDTNETFVKKLNEALSNEGDGLSVSLVTETEKNEDGSEKEDGETTYKLKFTNSSSSNDITVTGTNISGSELDIGDAAGEKLVHTGSLVDLGISGGASTSVSSNGSSIRSILGEDFGWDENNEYKFTLNGKEITISGDDDLNTVMSKISTDTGVKMTYNSVTKAFKLQANETGLVNTIDFGDDDSFMRAFGFFDEDAKHTEAADAKVSIDGIETTRSSNELDVDGLKMTLNAKTDGAVTVKSTYDTTAMVDKIKEFVNEYNDLIAELSTQTKTTRSKSGDYDYYEPLLDEEKKEMSDDEIEKWETEAKKGLLYNDSTINNLLSSMRSALYNVIETSDGTKISLFSIGITTTSDYTQGGKLEIDEDKLAEAIRTQGDKIQELFTKTTDGLGDKMKKIIDGAVGANGTLRAKAGIVGTASVNENILSKQLKTINEQIAKEKARLATKENYYYKLFAQMESAVSNSNNQLDAIYSMLV